MALRAPAFALLFAIRKLTMQLSNLNNNVEKLRTIPEACKLMGIRKHALRRAVSGGLVPFYTPFGSRRYVRVSEVETAIAAHTNGRVKQ
jgi:excisionase family DNA binding protein